MSIAEIPSPPVTLRRFPAEQRPTVLVAEDQPKLRERIVRQLIDLGVVPAVAVNGFDAIRVAERLRPDVILLDGLLPEMHGFEVARYLRRLSADYKPRIAIVTAIYKGIRYENEAKLTYGVDEYLLKPVTSEQLAGVLDRSRRAA